jgi:hypothetical protein
VICAFYHRNEERELFIKGFAMGVPSRLPANNGMDWYEDQLQEDICNVSTVTARPLTRRQFSPMTQSQRLIDQPTPVEEPKIPQLKAELLEARWLAFYNNLEQQGEIKNNKKAVKPEESNLPVKLLFDT